MVYDIDYNKDGNTYTLFDIDIGLKPMEFEYDRDSDQYVKTDKWISEIYKSTNSRWVAKFVFDKIHDEQTLKTFEQDCEKIDYIRSYLFEHLNNRWLPMNEASDKLYKHQLPILKEMIYNFANKWGLTINED